jgi:ferredoxin
MKKSTKSLFRLHGWRNIVDFFHGYIYARFVKQYVAFLRWASGAGEDKAGYGSAAKYLEERYHSKVLAKKDAEKIIRLDSPVEIKNPERVIPFDIANRIVIENPGSIVAIRCPCRETKGEGACTPREVCLIIGSPYTDFVLEHGTSGARALTRKEALNVLAKTESLGWVHTAWFKDAMGGRFYAICNCCSCCCMGIKAMRDSDFSARYLLPSGYVASVDADACDACGLCLESCSFDAIEMNGAAAVDKDRCFGCGVCGSRCSVDAIVLSLDPSKGQPMDLDAL